MEACGNDQLDLPNALAAGVTDKLWEISDIVQVLEDFENQRKTEPSFEIERERIGQGYFVRATLTNRNNRHDLRLRN